MKLRISFLALVLTATFFTKNAKSNTQFFDPKNEENLSQKLLIEIQKDLRSQIKIIEKSENKTLRAKLLFQLSQVLKDENERLEILDQGKELTEILLKRKENDPELLLLWTAHAGVSAGIRKNIIALFSISKIEDRLKKLNDIDSSYFFAAADRGLGTMYLKAPSIISVGSMKKAKKYLESSMEKFPNYPGNQIAWAEYLFEDGKKDEALKLAQEVLKSSNDKAYFFDHFEWQERAQTIIENSKVR